jgi:hypothetical protein
MSPDPQSWKATFEDGSLHIEGVARYPNTFSTAGLERASILPPANGILAYQVVFYRDKEPFCGPDLIGPVHHFEQKLPTDAVRIRVTVDGQHVEIPIPPAA